MHGVERYDLPVPPNVPAGVRLQVGDARGKLRLGGAPAVHHEQMGWPWQAGSCHPYGKCILPAWEPPLGQLSFTCLCIEEAPIDLGNQRL